MTTRMASYFGDIKSCGRNDGSPLYITQMLRVLFGNENVAHIFPAGDLSKNGVFDYHWLVDWGEDALGYQNFEMPHPSIYITSDTHLGYGYRKDRALKCDYIFCNQRKAVEDFIKDGVNKDRVFWLPHAFDPNAYNAGLFNVKTGSFDTDVHVLKKYKTCFIGNLNDRNRVEHLDRLFKEFNDSFYWGTQRFHDASNIFNQSKIVFNVTARGELNMRFFEALGSKSFLLSDHIPDEDNVFIEGVHYVGYKDKDDMIDKAKYYLAHEDERNEIAEAGYKEALGNHTYMHRVTGVLETIGIPYDKEAALSYLNPKKLELVRG